MGKRREMQEEVEEVVMLLRIVITQCVLQTSASFLPRNFLRHAVRLSVFLSLSFLLPPHFLSVAISRKSYAFSYVHAHRVLQGRGGSHVSKSILPLCAEVTQISTCLYVCTCMCSRKITDMLCVCASVSQKYSYKEC